MRIITQKILISLLVLSGACSFSIAQEALQFNDSKRFKILQLTDTHYKTGSPKSEVVITMINEVLDIEQPDLVILTGDIVTKSPVIKGWEAVTTPMVERGIPWAMVLGNHDDEQDLNRSEILLELNDIPFNYTRYSTPGSLGTGNYILPVISSKGKKSSTILYCMDSNAYSPIKGVGKYGWFHRDQINWFAERSGQLKAENNGKALPSLAFFHIPLPEYVDAWENGDKKPVGVKNEDVCAPAVNSGMFHAMLEQENIMGCFVGHDHVNDYISSLYGIALVYGRFSGGGDTYGDLTNGARVIVLEEDKWEFTTWIRLRGGEKINQTRHRKEKEPV